MRSLLAFWAGGASGESTPPAKGGVRSMLAFWAGGAFGGIATPAITPPTPTPDGGGVGRQTFPGAWGGRKKLPKKKRDLLDELDEALALLREKIVEQPEAPVEPWWAMDMRRARAVAESNLAAEATLAQLRHHIARLKEISDEIDDEEALLMAIH